jgi:hypothetical protein
MSKNSLTPLARVNETLQGRKPDKLPIMVLNSNTFICQYYRITVEQFLEEPAVTAELSEKFLREFEVDYGLIANGYILYGCGPELGVEWKFAGENFPGFVGGVIKKREDVEKLEVPQSPTGYFKNYLEMIKRLHRSLGEEFFLAASMLGPFSVACFLRGIEEVLLDSKVDLDFFHLYMKRCTELSKYFGGHVLATGLKRGLLNEIFLTPEMMAPSFYHRHIAPYDREVQVNLGPERAPNGLAAFMGREGDSTSQREGWDLYQAFYGITESVEAVRRAADLKMPGFPLPISVSGRALASWDKQRLLSFLEEAVGYLVKERGLFPSIALVSVQAESREKAGDIAEKMKAVAEFRNRYEL